MEEDSSCFDAPLCCVVSTGLHRSLLPELEIQFSLISVCNRFVTKKTTEIPKSNRTQATNDYPIHCSFRKLHSRGDTRACIYSGRKVQPVLAFWRRPKKCTKDEESTCAKTAMHHKGAGSQSQRVGAGICIRRDSPVSLLQWYMRSCCAQLRPLFTEHSRKKENKKRESESKTLLQASSIR